jgi:AcrR family transcriptional regulator
MTQDSLQHGPGAPEPGLVWDRVPEEKQRRERPTRDAVVTAAVALADAEGLEAVSIRRVAAALGTRPMGLYAFFDRKDDLIDLMADAVLDGTVLPELPPGWREGLSALARATRDVSLAHPWLAAATGTRVQLGPHAMRHFEQSLQAVSGLAVSPARKLAILRAVDTYALGHVQISLAQHETLRREGLTPGQWQASAGGYLARLAASGDYPNLAAFGADAVLQDQDEEAAFETGLNWLLNGIAAETSPVTRLRRPAMPARPGGPARSTKRPPVRGRL